jgi:hypothetical protein
MKNPLTGNTRRILFAGTTAVLMSFSFVATPVKACTCVITMPLGAGTISGLVGAGSAGVITAMTTGFNTVGSQVSASSAQNEKQIITALDSMTKRLATEIRNMPVYEAEIDERRNNLSPSRQATDECRYGDRAKDLAAADQLAANMQRNLSRATNQYNNMPSTYEEGTDSDSRFMAQTAQVLRNMPEIKTAPMELINVADSFGALTPQQTQNASTALNLTLNPSPPARRQNPTSPQALTANARADLHNLRMSIPQTVSQQILSYETPLLATPNDSWAAETLTRIDPNASQLFADGDLELSKSDLLRLMATHRTKDAVWSGNVAAKERSGVLKDLALVKADHLSLEYELWVQDRNMALMVSQLLASKIRQEGN